MALINRQNIIVSKRTRNGRTPVIAGGAIAGGAIPATSSGTGATGGASLTTENTFTENQYFEKNIFAEQGVYIGDYTTPAYASLTYSAAADTLTSSAAVFKIFDYELERTASGELTASGDLKIVGNLHVNGTVYAYSSDEINVGDSWFNLGVADVTGQDGGIRILTASGATVMSKIWYDVSAAAWFTDTKQIASRAATLTNNYVPIYDSANTYFKNSTLLYDGSKFKVGSNFLALYNSLSTNTLLQWDGSKITSSNTLNNSLGVSTNLTVGNNAGSTSFSSGFAGSGWQVTKSGSTYTQTIDNLTIRGALSAYEFLINQISAKNGSELLSSSGKVASYASNVITFDDATGHSVTAFAVGDIIITKRTTINNGVTLKQIVRQVSSISGLNVTVTTTSGGPSDTGSIEAGDVFVRIGNVSDSDRQGGIYLTADDSNAPYIDIFANVDSWADWTGITKTKARIGNLAGITSSAFGALSGYGIFTNNAYLENCFVSGRFATSFDSARIDLDDVLTLTPNANNYELQYNAAGSIYFKLRLTSAPADGQEISFIAGGSYQTNFGLYCDDASVYIRKKDGTLANSTTNALWTYNYKYTGSGARVVKLIYRASTNYLIEI